MPSDLQTTPEVTDVINTFRTIAQLPSDALAAYVISMAHTASDVLAVVLLQVPPFLSQVLALHWTNLHGGLLHTLLSSADMSIL